MIRRWLASGWIESVGRGLARSAPVGWAGSGGSAWGWRASSRRPWTAIRRRCPGPGWRRCWQSTGGARRAANGRSSAGIRPRRDDRLGIEEGKINDPRGYRCWDRRLPHSETFDGHRAEVSTRETIRRRVERKDGKARASG